MKLKISGKVYDLEAAIPGTELGTIRLMQREYGWTIPRLARMAEKMKVVSDPMAILEDAEMLDGLLIMIWLARVYNGETMSLDESNKIRMDAIELIPDEEAEPAADPKEQTDSAVDEGPRTDPPVTSSKTSRRRSTKTSPTSATTGQG